MATSFGTRRALGRRYAVDPELLLEAERLQQEFNLMPGREARALQQQGMGIQQSQFAQNLALQEQQQKEAAKSGMVGTASGALTNAAIVRAMTMKPGEGFFGGKNLTVPTPEVPPTYTPGYGNPPYATPTPEYTPGMGMPPYADASTVNPAFTDMGASGMTTAPTTPTAGGITAAGGGSTFGGVAGSVGGAAMMAGPYVAAGKIGMPIFGKVMGQGFRDAFGVDPKGSSFVAQANRVAGRGGQGAIKPMIEEFTHNKVPEVVYAATNPAGWLLDSIQKLFG
jgi:hypothetical protein